MAVTFDTLKFARRLKSAHVPDEQAEAIAEATGQELVTKSDLRVATTELRQEMAEIRAELRREMAENTTKTIRWMAGMLILQGGAIAALVKLL